MTNEVIVAQPDIANSTGHQRLSRSLIVLAGKLELEPQEISFTSPYGTDSKRFLLQRFLWDRLDSGKEAASNANGNNPVMTEALYRVAGVVRNNKLINHVLTSEFRHWYKNHIAPIYSSHYMPIKEASRSGVGAILLTPDLSLHPPFLEAARNPEITVVSTSLHATETLIVNGIPEYRIINGAIYSDSHIQAAEQRKRIIQEINDSDDTSEQHLLITLGGGGTALESAIKVLENLPDGVRLKVLVGSTVVNGKNMPRNIAFRKIVMEATVFNNNIEMIDGTESLTREQEIDLFYAELEDPNLVAIISRPNEIPGIVGPLNIASILLDPFQHHEEMALECLTARSAAMTWQDFVGNGGTAKFFDLVKSQKTTEVWYPPAGEIELEKMKKFMALQ